ncbi:MAG: response regulator [Verrucomicrobiales bacterium]
MSIGYPDQEPLVDTPPSPGHAAILVVDEDPAFQLGLKTFLREYVGFEKVFTARSGQEALDLIESEDSIEVVTLDYQMPGMTGIDVMQELARTRRRPLSVMMITGYPSQELEAQFRSLGSPTLLASHFVPKPVEFEKLEPLVLRAHEELLAAKRTGTEEPGGAADQSDDEELEHTFAELEAKLGAQSLQLTSLREKVDAQRGKWRTDFLIVALLVFAVWLAGEFGLLDEVEGWWTDFKDEVTEAVAPTEAAPGTSESDSDGSGADAVPADTRESAPLPESGGTPL